MYAVAGQEGAISILHDLPPWSISILHDGKDEVFNTAKVKAPSTQKKITTIATFDWQSYDEEAPSSDGGDTFAMPGLYEQLNVTRDASDYLWYLIEIDISPNEQFLTNGQLPVLTVMSAGHALHVFINN
ncbi:beta-galactosidase-like [Bidens hawaiensis]|uniref:beta-galactosidase-like n=1 Tax=Bidens hawaiensis TaxID=980011 RepID=UPI004049EBFC